MIFEDPNKTHRSRVDQFDDAHGDSVRIGSWVYFHDGARREMWSYGALQDPPINPFERCQRIVTYYEARLQRAVTAFHDLQQRLGLRAQNAARDGSPPPPRSALEELKELQREVRRRDRDLKQAKKSLEDVTPAHLKQANIVDGENRQSADDFLAAMKNIEVQ
jgi:hypothetical protein